MLICSQGSHHYCTACSMNLQLQVKDSWKSLVLPLGNYTASRTDNWQGYWLIPWFAKTSSVIFLLFVLNSTNKIYVFIFKNTKKSIPLLHFWSWLTVVRLMFRFLLHLCEVAPGVLCTCPFKQHKPEPVTCLVPRPLLWCLTMHIITFTTPVHTRSLSYTSWARRLGRYHLVFSWLKPLQYKQPGFGYYPSSSWCRTKPVHTRYSRSIMMRVRLSMCKKITFFWLNVGEQLHALQYMTSQSYIAYNVYSLAIQPSHTL